MTGFPGRVGVVLHPFTLEALNPRPLQNAPFQSLRLSAESQRCIRILILEIFNIFLWLKSSYPLILNEIEHFSKVSTHKGDRPLNHLVRIPIQPKSASVKTNWPQCQMSHTPEARGIVIQIRVRW